MQKPYLDHPSEKFLVGCYNVWPLVTIDENAFPRLKHFKAHFVEPLPRCLHRDLSWEPRFQCGIGEQGFVDPLAEVHCCHIWPSFHGRVRSYILSGCLTKLFTSPENSGTMVPSLLALREHTVVCDEVSTPLTNCPVGLVDYFGS